MATRTNKTSKTSKTNKENMTMLKTEMTPKTLRILATAANVNNYGRYLANKEVGKYTVTSDVVDGKLVVMVQTSKELIRITGNTHLNDGIHGFVVKDMLTNPATGEMVAIDSSSYSYAITRKVVENGQAKPLSTYTVAKIAHHVATKAVFAAIAESMRLGRADGFVFVSMDGKPIPLSANTLFPYSEFVTGTISDVITKTQASQNQFLTTGEAFKPEAATL
jgi:hypothetical protein